MGKRSMGLGLKELTLLSLDVADGSELCADVDSPAACQKLTQEFLTTFSMSAQRVWPHRADLRLSGRGRRM
jgi:hypothetical protein